VNRLYPIDEVIESLREEEGWSNTIYKCTQGHWTIGYGRNVDPHTGIGISREEGEFMLANDVRRTIEELENAFPQFGDLDQPRTAVLVELGLPTGTADPAQI
jgi:GH24 family phage-related lysozyme (muramidase)